MSYDEISATIEAYNVRKLDNAQERANMDYNLASLIGLAVVSPKHMPRNVRDAYPGLFKKNEHKPQDWRAVKEQMSLYAKVHNRKIKGVGARDG